MLMSRATFEGLSRLCPDARPFVLTRSSFAAGQRYAAIWPGDNTTDWTALRQSLPTLMGLGLSGFAFVGADIGGFAHDASAELYTRWIQASIFSPFMRAHTEAAAADKEPWSYGARHEAVNRRAIELRYELLPEIYDIMEEASRTGVPAMRSMFLEYPEDRETWSRDDQLFFGPDLLVAPVLREGVVSREVYLPSGEWFDFWTGAPAAGGRTLRVPVTIDSLPIYVRAGAFVFRQPVVQHTGQMVGQPLFVHVYPAAASEASFYEDDGETMAYRHGESARRGRRAYARGFSGGGPAIARKNATRLSSRPFWKRLYTRPTGLHPRPSGISTPIGELASLPRPSSSVARHRPPACRTRTSPT
jgi:alpha-glucosidase